MAFDPKVNRNEKDAIGDPGDAISTNTTEAWTSISLLKGIFGKLGGGTSSALAADVAQGSTTAGQLGPLSQGAVTTAAPTYTNGQTNPFSLKVNGDLRVADTDGNALLTSMNATLSTLNLSTDGLEASLGIITETAPATDTASSGLNGRLQRVAQNITTLIAATSPTAITIPISTRFDEQIAQDRDTADAIAIALDQLHLDLIAAKPVPNATLRLPSAANSTNATAGVIGPCRVFNVQGLNAATSTRYLKLYDLARAPVAGTDIPKKTIALPALVAFALDWANPYQFTNGLAYALTTGVADSDTGAVTAADILALNIDYG